MALTPEDMALIDKSVKNNVRVALAQYECAPGGSIYKLMDDKIHEAFGPAGEFYSGEGPYARLNETNFLNLCKLITGEEVPTGYTAKTLHDAFIRLLEGTP